MKAAVVRKHGEITVEDVPEIKLGDYDALVEIEACGICNGTDMKLLDGHFPPFDATPFVIGHESVGQVVEVGSKVKNYRVGDTVIRPMLRYDNNESDIKYAWGGIAEKGKVTDMQAFLSDNPGSNADFWWTMQRKGPCDISAEELIIMITMMETWSWLELFEVSEKTSVLVWGLGPVGLAMCSCCKAMNVPVVIGLDIDENALKRSSDFGVDIAINAASNDLDQQVKDATKGKGADRIIEAVGNRSLVTRSESFVSDFGRIGIYGIEPTINGIKPKPYELTASGQYSVHFFYPNELAAQNKVIEQFKKGNLTPSRFITDRFNLDDAAKAFETVRSKKTLKTIIEM